MTPKFQYLRWLDERLRLWRKRKAISESWIICLALFGLIMVICRVKELLCAPAVGIYIAALFCGINDPEHAEFYLSE